MSDDESVYRENNFHGDATPIAMENYRDDVISDNQLNVLNDLKKKLSHENLIYLNKHKEIGVIATLVLKEILKKTPKNLYAHVANFLKDPKIPDLIANFSYSNESLNDKLINIIDAKIDSMAANENIAGLTSAYLEKN